MKFNFSLLTALIFFTLCQPLFAQKNFEAGYLINNKQDTLKGSIEYLNWSKNPDRINFRTSLSIDEKVYGVSEISSFFVHGESYVKAFVEVDDTPYKTDQLSNSPMAKSHADTVFLRVLAAGPKSLFSLITDGEKEDFYIKNGDNYQWLTSFRYAFQQGDKSGIVAVDTYKQQLSEYLGDCPAMAGKTALLGYSQTAIVKLFRTYYQKCSAANQNVVYKTDGIKTGFGVIGGLSMTKVNLKGPTATLIFTGSFPLSSQIAGGIFLNLVLPRTQKKVSIYNELFFSSYKAVNHSEKYISDQDHSYTDLTLGFSYLKLNNMFRYTTPLHAASLYFNVGISNGIAIAENNSKRTVSYVYSDQATVTESKLVKETRKYEQGLLFGVGTTVKKISFEVRCELGNGISSYNDLKTTARRYFALLSYQIK